MKSSYYVISPKTARESNHPPIIFLHAIFESKFSWKKVAPTIVEKTGRKAFALDARNHGQSPRSPEMNFDVMAKDVLEFMDDLNIPKAVIIGHSMGGRTAITIALKHPERVSALVVEEMTPKDVKSDHQKFVPALLQAGVELLRNFPPEMELDEAKRELAEMMISFGKDFIDVERIRRNYDPSFLPLTKVGRSFVPEANTEVLVEMLQSNALVQNLPQQNLRFDGDALFLHGSKPFFNLSKDPTIPKLFPRAVVRKVEGASHMMHLDSPEEYSQIVSDFILQTSLPKSKY